MEAAVVNTAGVEKHISTNETKGGKEVEKVADLLDCPPIPIGFAALKQPHLRGGKFYWPIPFYIL